LTLVYLAVDNETVKNVLIYNYGVNGKYSFNIFD
jgi:hypothetical protein